MKIRKFLSGVLALNIIMQNFNTKTMANSIEDRYQTLEGEYIRIDESIEGELHEIEIFGDTWQDENNLEEIQSVGDLYVDDNGNPILDEQGREQYKIDTITTGKNLFDVNNEWAICTYAGGLIKDEEPLHYTFVDNKVIVENQNIHSNVLGYKLRVLNNKSVSISIKDIGYTDTLHYSCYSKDWTYTKTQHVISPKKVGERILYQIESGDIPDQTEYIFLGIGNHNISNYEIEDIMIEYGEYTGSYTQYQSKNIELLLPTQLQKVGKIADRLYWDSSMNRYLIEKNIGNVFMDISLYKEYVVRDYSYENEYTNKYYISNFFKNKNFKAYDLLTTGIKSVSYDEMQDINNSKVCMSNSTVGSFNIRVPKSIDDVDKLVEFMSNLNILAYLPLNNPNIIETNIASKLILPTYKEVTHIYTETQNGINPTLKVVVDRVINKVIEAIELAKINPTIENISIARMWVNLLDESIKKDELESEITNITGVKDLVIEKKSVSINADLYIKMKNTLSLSLDTNSIIFDEVDTTEDTEMQKAVNLTVSSSLPYKVNAYLEDELYNNKTETLDKSILNIRANGKSAYQAFTDLSTPITLLDDQEAGVDTIHGIDLRLASNDSHKADVYKTSIKFEVIQK